MQHLQMLIDYVLSFTRNNAGNSRNSFPDHYVPKVEINDFNVLIDGKSFFDFPVKSKEEAYKKIIKFSNDNEYTTGNLLDFIYFKENYRLIAIDLSKQTKLKDPQQSSLLENLMKLMEQQCFSLPKNQKKLLLIFNKVLSQSYK